VRAPCCPGGAVGLWRLASLNKIFASLVLAAGAETWARYNRTPSLKLFTPRPPCRPAYARSGSRFGDGIGGNTWGNSFSALRPGAGGGGGGGGGEGAEDSRAGRASNGILVLAILCLAQHKAREATRVHLLPTLAPLALQTGWAWTSQARPVNDGGCLGAGTRTWACPTSTTMTCPRAAPLASLQVGITCADYH